MKIYGIMGMLAIAAGVGAAQESPVEAGEIPPWLVEEEAEAAPEPELSAEQKAVVEEVAQLMAELHKLTQGVYDRATADAAAPRMKQIMERIRGMHEQTRTVPFRYVLERASELGADEMKVLQCEERLERNGFYGSVAMAEAVGAPPEAAFELSSLSEEAYQRIAEEVTAAVERNLPMATGGPGFDALRAWKLPQGVECDDVLLRTILPEGFVEVENNVLIGPGERRYWVVFYRLQREGKMYALSLWVDVEDADFQESSDGGIYIVPLSE
ncbi:MAG: hypothetical protein IJA63_10465 [Akkermansia sp.]|nr:hypothetical protein [Akkermansia sp.]